MRIDYLLVDNDLITIIKFVGKTTVVIFWHNRVKYTVLENEISR